MFCGLEVTQGLFENKQPRSFSGKLCNKVNMGERESLARCPISLKLPSKRLFLILYKIQISNC